VNSPATPTLDNKRSIQKTSRNRRVASAAGSTARWILLFLAICIILIALLLVAARIGLPWLGGYKDKVEVNLSERLNSPVVINDLAVRWEGAGPKLSATGVAVGDSQSGKVTLDEVLINMDVLKSVSQRGPVIDELTLVGAQLAMETGSDGRLRLQGVEGTGQAAESDRKNPDVLSWLMDTSRVELLESSITLVTEPGQLPLTIDDLNITAVNDGDLHQLRVDMQLPEALGGKVEMGLDLVGNSNDIKNAEADIHLKADSLKADAWRSLQAERLHGLPLSTTGIARLDADLQLELWGSLADGRLQSARGQLEVTDLLNLNSGEKVVDSISTDVVFADLPFGWEVTADSLKFEDDGEITSVDNVTYQYKPAENTAWKLDARGKSLEIGLATKLSLSLFDKDADLPRARWLADAEPQGRLHSWDASFARVDGRPDFSLFSIFNELQMKSAVGVPGVTQLAGTIDMNHNIGKITMQGIDMSLDLPAAYKSPLQLQQLSGELDINAIDPLRTSIQGDVFISDNGLSADTRLEVKSKVDESPHVFVQSTFALDDIGRTKHYVPTRLLRPPTTRWLSNALLAGKATNGELLMFGKTAEFPFTENQGVFRVGFDVEDATMKYMTTWPEATGLQGRFDIEGVSMRGVASDGYIDSMRLSSLDARIDNMLNPVLELKSTSAGSLPKLLQFANTGPLKRRLKPALSDISATGRAQMDLNVSVPLKRKKATTSVASAQQQSTTATVIPGLKVNGSVFLRNNDIKFGRAQLALDGVDGAVGFTHRGIKVNNLNGLLFGRPVRVDAKSEGSGINRTNEFTIKGPVKAVEMLENYGIPLTQFAEGESHWNVSVRVPATASGFANRGIQIAAVSELVGTRLQMPQPLGKPVGTAQRLALSTTIKNNGKPRVWLIDYGQFMRSHMRVDKNGMKSFSVRFGGGAANENIDSGIRLDGNVDKLALDSWVRDINRFIKGLKPAAEPSPILPVSGNLRVSEFIAGRQGVGGGVLKFNTDNTYINGVIESTWLAGSVRYPRQHWRKDQALVARVGYADKQFFDALKSGKSDDKANELDPRLLPPIEARVSKLSWDRLDLKDLNIRTSPTVSGLSIDTFGFAHDTAQLIGEGYWRLRDPQQVNATLKDQHVTKLNLTLQSNDFGRTATNLGFGGTMNEGEGVISGSLLWSGPAYKPSIETVSGEAELELNRGRILKVDPGAARLVGLFAIQTLPRRLSLDFKDLVLDGLDYETIRGTVQLANGVAHAPLVQLNGSVGVIDIAGESNLLTQQYNQRITVLPRVSAALPIIGVVTGGATAGLGALFAGGFLKAIGLDFDRIGLREYELTGPWEKPKLEVVPFEPSAQ